MWYMRLLLVSHHASAHLILFSSLTGNVAIISDITESAANTTAGDDDVKSKPSAQLSPTTGESIMYHHQPLYIIFALATGTVTTVQAEIRSPSVNPALAVRVEATHFPDSTATRDVVPEATGMSSSAPLIVLLLVKLVMSLSSQKTILWPTMWLVMMKSSQGKPLN